MLRGVLDDDFCGNCDSLELHVESDESGFIEMCVQSRVVDCCNLVVLHKILVLRYAQSYFLH